MASIGLNVSRDGRHDPALIRSLGATWLRIVAMPHHDLSDYFRRCRAAGLKILLVFARESGGDYAEYARRYATMIDAIQVGNEPDLVSSSSWTMSQVELSALGRSVRAIFPRPFTLVCAGLASGHPEWPADMDLSWCDALAFHPYLKDAPNPDDIEDLPDIPGLLSGYQAYGLPLLVTEWGWWGDREPRASEEVRDMIGWAGQTGDLECFMYFCTDDAMVPPFGLLDASSQPKPRAAPFTEQATDAVQSLWPYVEQTEPEPDLPAKPDPWEFWSAEQIAAASGCPLETVAEHWPRLVEQLNHAGIADRPVQAAVIGTTAIETASTFQPIHEFQDWNQYPNSGGYPPHYDGGPTYHGRGFIQLTHRSNYAKYGPKVAELWGTSPNQPDFDLVGNPDLALNPDIAAAVMACFFRDTATTQGYRLVDAARTGDWEWVRRLVQGGTAGLPRLVAITNALGEQGQAPAAPVYDPEHPAHPQEESFDCSQESLEWALWAYGRTTSDDWLESTMIREGVMSAELGLMDASGAGLAAFVRRHYAELGYTADHSDPVTFDQVAAEAGRWPVLIGGRRWNHWSGVRKPHVIRGTLLLANPAEGHMGVGQEMTRAQLANLGPFSMVRVKYVGGGPVEPPKPDTRIPRALALIEQAAAILNETV